MDHSTAFAIVLDLMHIWDDDKKSSRTLGFLEIKGDPLAHCKEDIFSIPLSSFSHPSRRLGELL